MLINIDSISEKGLHLKDALDMDENLLLEKDSRFLEELSYQLHLRRDKKQIRVQGKIKTMVSVSCIRCLDYYDLKLQSRFDLILFPMEEIEAKRVALNQDDLEYIFYQGKQIDIIKILSEQVNLFLPLYPLCHQECRGLCSCCGCNLNQESCDCEETKNEMTFLFELIKR